MGARTLWVSVVGAVALAVCAAGAFWWHSTADVRMVTRSVASALSDPDSAVFKGVFYNAKHDVGCGLVNARNRMGGMTGFRGFVAFASGEVRAEPELSDPAWGGWDTLSRGLCSPDDPAARGFWDALAEHRYRTVR